MRRRIYATRSSRATLTGAEIFSGIQPSNFIGCDISANVAIIFPREGGASLIDDEFVGKVKKAIGCRGGVNAEKGGRHAVGSYLLSPGISHSA